MNNETRKKAMFTLLSLLLLGCSSTKPKEHICIGDKLYESEKGWAITYTGTSCSE